MCGQIITPKLLCAGSERPGCDMAQVALGCRGHERALVAQRVPLISIALQPEL
jgi:hypothetical protein